MKRIEFVGNNEEHKQFLASIRSSVNDYFKESGVSKKGNSSMRFKTATMLFCYFAPFIVLLTVQLPIWLALLAVILMGIGEAGIGMSVMHDAAHGAYSKKHWVNRLVSSSMYLLGSTTFNWKIQHNILHHTYTNIYGFDQDIDTKAVIRLCDHAPLKRFHRFQHIYAFFLYGLLTLSKLITDFSQLIEFTKEGFTRRQQTNPTLEMTKLLLSKALYFLIIIVLPIWLTTFAWWEVLIGFVILHATAGMIMSTIFQMAHVVEGTKQPVPDAAGNMEMEWAVHELQTTSDFARNNAFLNWYVGGLNFQIEHHLFPNICHVHYKKIAPIVEKAADKFGITYNLKPSFINALSSHIRRLKELGKAKRPKSTQIPLPI